MTDRVTINGSALPNLPWEERPEGAADASPQDALWRSARNPIIPHDLIPSSNSIFNSAVVPFEGEFAGVFRCDSKTRRCWTWNGRGGCFTAPNLTCWPRMLLMNARGTCRMSPSPARAC